MHTPSDLFSLAVSGRADIVIADPGRSSGHCAETMLQIRRELPSVLVAAYARLEPAIVSLLLRLASGGIDEVILFRHDDSAARFEELVERRARQTLAGLVLTELAPTLGNLPPRTRTGVIGMFQSPVRYRTAGDLADASAVGLRTLHRQLRSAGIGSARLLVACARIVGATSLLHDPGRSAREVARRLRYSKPEQLAAQIKQLTGRSLRELRRDANLPELARDVVTRLRGAVTRRTDSLSSRA